MTAEVVSLQFKQIPAVLIKKQSNDQNISCNTGQPVNEIHIEGICANWDLMTVNTPCKCKQLISQQSIIGFYSIHILAWSIVDTDLEIWSRTYSSKAYTCILLQTENFFPPTLPTITYLETKNWMFLDLAWKWTQVRKHLMNPSKNQWL